MNKRTANLDFCNPHIIRNEKMKIKKKVEFTLIEFAGLMFLAFLIGSGCTYLQMNNGEIYKGCWAQAKTGEHWVCVNMETINDYGEMVSVCNHEVAHEMFARTCEKEDKIGECIEFAINLSREKNG